MTTTTMTMTTTPTTMTEPFRFDDRREALTALAEAAGWEILDDELIRMEARGATFTTGHRVRFRHAGVESTQVVFIDGGSPDRDRVVALLSSDGETLCSWIYPHDPALPALASVMSPPEAGALLVRLGIDPASARLELLTYRPGKRAVVRLVTPDRTLYLKVVRPTSVAALVEQHHRWRTHGLPAPRVANWAPEGLIALDGLPGTEAIHVTDALDSRPDFLDALAGLCERIAALPMDHVARPSLTRRMSWYLARIASLAPGQSTRIASLGELIQRRLTQYPAGEPVGIHGDLHLGQIMVDPDHPADIIGVLDIDTAGLGDAADDLGALYAHLIVTAELRAGTPASAAHARSLADRWAALPRFDSVRPRAAAITATHFLGHALSGSLAAPRALEMALMVLADESALTVSTDTSHPR